MVGVTVKDEADFLVDAVLFVVNSDSDDNKDESALTSRIRFSRNLRMNWV